MGGKELESIIWEFYWQASVGPGAVPGFLGKNGAGEC